MLLTFTSYFAHGSFTVSSGKQGVFKNVDRHGALEKNRQLACNHLASNGN